MGTLFLPFHLFKAGTYQHLEPAAEREQRTGAAELLFDHRRWQPPLPGDVSWNRRQQKVTEIRAAEIVQRLLYAKRAIFFWCAKPRSSLLEASHS